MSIIILIITHIYHSFIDSLSAHTIQINLNIIFYMHVELSPTNAVYIKV